MNAVKENALLPVIRNAALDFNILSIELRSLAAELREDEEYFAVEMLLRVCEDAGHVIEAIERGVYREEAGDAH